MSRARLIATLFSAAFLAACTLTKPAFEAGTPCTTNSFSVTDTFEGARRGRCVAIADDAVRIHIRQEDKEVRNKSPWYAFKVENPSRKPVTIQIRYHSAKHRYVPKLSTDGENWTALPADAVTLRRGDRLAELHLAPDASPFWIAAQELILPRHYEAWLQQQQQKLDLDLSVLGRSRRGLPIRMLDTGDTLTDVLLIVGRQHPPEVSGAFAFSAFAETLYGDTELAKSFRDEFRILAIPLINPDGVIGGNWRHNLGSTDLNRDWGPFTQPETRAVQSLLDTLDADGSKIRAFADFHSTRRNLFYTQDLDNPTSPPEFVRRWLSASAQRIQDYDFTNEEGPVSEQANSKNYMFKRYGIPSVTYEVGDETDRATTRTAAVIFAEELMRLLLCQKQRGWQSSCE